jgi:hypothetical protein
MRLLTHSSHSIMIIIITKGIKKAWQPLTTTTTFDFSLLLCRSFNLSIEYFYNAQWWKQNVYSTRHVSKSTTIENASFGETWKKNIRMCSNKKFNTISLKLSSMMLDVFFWLNWKKYMEKRVITTSWIEKVSPYINIAKHSCTWSECIFKHYFTSLPF